jgi:pSer/pThr/pTyr-binding forkhead associated (FHA) protein
MPKLVCLTAGFTDKVFEVKPEKGTLGRLEDNRFFLPEPSVSSHHCELWAKGDEIVVKDLGSTNGTFLNEVQLGADKEGTLRPGQMLRLGQVELRYETGKRQTDQPRPTVKIPTDDAGKTTVVPKNPAFQKKTNNINKIFLAVGAVLVIIILALLFVAFSGIGRGG